MDEILEYLQNLDTAELQTLGEAINAELIHRLDSGAKSPKSSLRRLLAFLEQLSNRHGQATTRPTR
jgi:hypothetical protein